MIQRVFSPENGFMPVLYKISNLFLLNILWILFSLPIITVGASTAALYTVTLKMCRNKESYICRSFVQAFRKNFRQGTLIWLAYAGVGGILYFNLYAAATGKLFAQAFFLTVFTVMSILYVMIGIYLAPVLAKFDTTIIQILKISIFFMLQAYYPYNPDDDCNTHTVSGSGHRSVSFTGTNYHCCLRNSIYFGLYLE